MFQLKETLKSTKSMNVSEIIKTCSVLDFKNCTWQYNLNLCSSKEVNE